MLGGVPYADSAEDADVAMTIACIHPDADFNLREFLLEVCVPTQLQTFPASTSPTFFLLLHASISVYIFLGCASPDCRRRPEPSTIGPSSCPAWSGFSPPTPAL